MSRAAARGLLAVARLAFTALVVVMPVRWQVDPLPHPSTDLPQVLVDVVVYGVDLLVVATVGAWLAARLLGRRRLRAWPAPILVPVVALVVLGWATAPIGLDPYLSTIGAVRLSLLVLLAAYVVDECRGVESLAVPVGLMVVVQSVVAIGQFIAQRSLGLQVLGEQRLDPAVVGISVVQLGDGTRILRAYGLTDHPNVLGGFLAVGLLLLVVVRPRGGAARVGQAIAVALGTAALVLALSRGAWIGFGLGLVVELAILGRGAIRRDRARWLALAGVAAVVVAAVGWQVRGELATRTGLVATETPTEIDSIDERLAQVRLGWRVLLDRPLTGAGMSAVPIAMRRLDPAFGYQFYPPHLVALDVADETGVLGGLAFAALLVAPWVLLLRRRGRWTSDLAAASGALAAIEIAGFVDDYPWLGGPGRTLLWLVVGLWAAAWLRAASTGGATGRMTGEARAGEPASRLSEAIGPS